MLSWSSLSEESLDRLRRSPNFREMERGAEKNGWRSVTIARHGKSEGAPLKAAIRALRGATRPNEPTDPAALFNPVVKRVDDADCFAHEVLVADDLYARGDRGLLRAAFMLRWQDHKGIMAEGTSGLANDLSAAKELRRLTTHGGWNNSLNYLDGADLAQLLEGKALATPKPGKNGSAEVEKDLPGPTFGL